jgi:hypothetical protein
MARAHRRDDLSLRRRPRQPPECPTAYGICDTCRAAQLLLFQKQFVTHLVLNEKQKMPPVIAPCELPYSGGVTDALAAPMPPGTRPSALFRVLTQFLVSSAMGSR